MAGYIETKNLRIVKLAEELADKIWNEVNRWNYFTKDTIGKQLVNSIDSVGANIIEGINRYSMYTKKLKFSIYLTILLSTHLTICLYAYETVSYFNLEVKMTGQVVASEILVKFKTGKEQQGISELGWVVLGTVPKIPKINVYRLKITESVESALDRARKNENVVYAEPNYIVKAYQTNDPQYNNQWALPKTDWFTAWTNRNALGLGAASQIITIAIIDSGVTYTHHDLTNNIWTNPNETDGDLIDNDGNTYVDDIRGWDFVSNDNDPADDNGHGTHVAGIAAGEVNNSTGIAGVSWRSRIMCVKVLGSSGSGTNANIASGIIYAVDKGAKVINLSLGSPFPSLVEKEAVDYAVARNVVVVAASGNDYSSYVGYPAGFDSVIAVGASEQNDKKVDFSNYGVKLDVVAPGYNIISTYPSGTTYYANGTSMASPFVAGLCALVLSQDSTLTPLQVKKRIEGGSDDIDLPLWDRYTGWGRVNVYKTLAQKTLVSIPSKVINYPNPFYPAEHEYVVIRIPEDYWAGKFQIRIYNIAGELVRQLNETTMETSADNGIAIWDGKNDDGYLVASGLYFYSVNTGAKKFTGKITVIK